MTDDFNVRFGSNARKFSQELIKDLAPARAELLGFIKLLGDVDHASKTALGRAGQAAAGGRAVPPAPAPQGGGATSALAMPKIDMSGVENEIKSMTAELDGMIGKLGTVITAMGRAVPGIENFVKKQNYSEGSRGKWDAGTDTPRGARGRFSSDPTAVRDSARYGLDPKMIANAIAARDSKLAQPARVDFSGLTKLQLDTAGFDRVVAKLDEIKAALASRGGARRVVEQVAEADEAKTTKAPKKGKGSKKLVEEAAVTADEMADLRKNIKLAEELLVKQYGGEAPAELTTALKAMRQKVAANDAKADREARGVTQGQQKAERRGKAEETRKKLDAIDTAEYDARKRQLALIQNAGRSDFEEQAKRRGQGGISHADLIETAQAFQNQGFDVQYGSKTNKAELAKRIASARQAFEAEHGTDIPESLQVGSKPRGPDKISDSMRRLLGDDHVSAADLAEEKRAREVRRLAYQVGNIPKDPTHRALEDMPGTIGVPPGMVKGGQYYDAFGFNAATSMLDQRHLGRAAVRAADPGFNPFALKEKDEISGGGDAAADAKRQFRELRRATRELDKLGEEYDRYSTSLIENRRGLHRLEDRVGTDREKAGDGDRMRGMEQSIRYAEKALNHPRFAGLQDVFEDPAYQAGRRNRQQTLQDQEEKRQRDKEKFEEEHGAHARTYINDAESQALAGAKNAIGGRGFRRPIPGLRPDGEKLAFTDDQRNPDDITKPRNPDDLKKLNRSFRAYRAGLRRETQLAEDLAQGVEGITQGHVKAQIEKTDNQITKFLNELGRIFGKGVAPGFEELIGRAPVTAKATKDEERRNRERVALNAVANARPQKPSDLAVAAQRAKDVERTKKLLAQADKDLTAAEKAEEAAIKAAAKAKKARPQAEQDIIEARTRAEAHEKSLALNPPADVMKDGAKLVGKDPRDLNAYERQQQQDYREYAAGYKERLSAARHDVSTTPDLSLTPEEQQARDASKQVAVAKQRQKAVANALAAREAREADAQGKIGGKEPEVTTLQKKLTRSMNARKELGTLRAAVRAAVKAEDEDAAAEARTERDAFREKNKRYLLTRGEQKALRQRIAGLNAADGEGGSGGGSGAGGAAGAGGVGGRGGGGGTLDILRQILASVNGIRDKLNRGVRGAGKAEDGEVGTPRSTRGRRLLEMSQAVDKTTGLPDDKTRAKAAAQQQADIERMKRAGILSQEVARAQAQATKINNQANREAEQTTRRSTEADRAKVRASQALATTLGKVDDATLREVAILERMNREGASNDKIVAQMTRTYAALDKQLAKAGVTPGGERHKQIRDVLSAANVNAQGKSRPISGNEADSIRRTAGSVDGFKVVDKAMAQQVPGGGIFGEQSAFTKAMFGNHGFWSRVMASTGTFVVRNFTAGFVFGLTNALQDVVRQAIITESTFIRVSDALEQTGRSSGNLRTQLQSISSQYGTSLEDVYETAAGLVGLFGKIDDIAGATKVVSQLQAISMGALNAQEAMGALASITGAYGSDVGKGVDGLTKVADVLTVVQNVIGANVETTAEGVGALSGLSKQLKIDFQDTAVYVAQIAKLTNQTGAAAGDQFSRILASMQTGRGRNALVKNLKQVKGKDTGIETQLGQGDYGGALKTLLSNWNDLSDGQQRNIAVTVAGQRQARAFYALMNGSNKVLDASARAHDAEGQAAQRAAAIANTLNGQIAKLTSNLTNLAQNLVRTGLLDFFGLLLKTVNGLLSGVNHVFSVINDFTDKAPILSFLKKLAAGLLGFVVTAKLAQMAFRGFRASLGEMRAGDGVMAAGLNGAAVKGGPTLRQSMFGAPAAGAAAFERKAARLRGSQQPLVYGPQVQPPVVPGGRGPIAEPGRMQGPIMSNGAFFSGQAAQEASRSTRALANSASLSGKALRGVGNSLNTLRESGMAAQLGMMALSAVIFTIMDGLAEHAARSDAYRKLYKDDTGHASATESGPGRMGKFFGKIGDVFGSGDQKAAEQYVGPWTEQMKANQKQTSGFFGTVKTGFATGWRNLNPGNWTKDTWSLNANTELNPLKGVLPDDVQKQIDTLTENLGKKPASLNNYDGQGRLIGKMSQSDQLSTQAKVGKAQINAAQKKIDENTGMTDEQRTVAMAELEKLKNAYEKNMATKILAAKGLAEQDILSTDQLSKLSGVTSMLVTTATSGGGVDARDPKYADMFKKRLEDTGVRTGSSIGKSLDKLAQGGLNKGDALTEVRKINDQAITQLQGRIKAAQAAGNEDEVATLQQTLDQFVTEQAGILQQIIDAVGATAAAIADAAAGRGNYGRAAGTIRSARNRTAGLRDRKSESPEVRALRDSAEAGQSEKAAELETQGGTWRLERQKSRGVSAQKSAQIDAQSAKIAYDNLVKERTAAQAAGAEGPTIQSLRQAKNTWLAAQRSSAVAAQDANIAQMTAAAAGIWNGVAAAAAAEGIALQQYSNAKKNFGAHSAEAANALAAYKGAQKTTQTTLDSVAESRRQALIASIPQGNAVGVARAQLNAAHAAVAAAKKYGENSTEYQGALAQLYSAQQQAVSAQMAVRSAQAQLAVAYATARGDTVGAARASERAARVQLAAARKASGGARSADVINAQAAAVQARAATRDAILQDRLDTIDFNLQMGKTTQSSAIAAMQQILRTANLTKQQRRDLLLKIKGMKDEISDTQWNFGSMELPTPYQMRRYVRAEAMNAAQRKMTPYRDATSLNLQDRPSRGGEPGAINDNRTVLINGADTAKVRKILEEILGKSVRTRTAQGRRR